MKAKRLTREELEKRVVVKLDKSIKADGVNGIMSFGEDNDYPQLMELAINGSVTAKAAAGIYAKFLAGMGFENEALNSVVVGRDMRNKDITLPSLLRQVADSCSVNNGFYLHRNTNLNNITGTVHLKPFKNGRFSKPDDTGYSAKMLFHDNWDKDKDRGRFNKTEAIPYHLFSSNEKVTQAQIGDEGQEKFGGQIYFQYLDNQYFYPLSPFDAAYLDCDTENQVGLYKNRQLRDGFMNKIVFRVQPTTPAQDEDGKELPFDEDELTNDIKGFMGADGESVLVIEDDINPDTGEFYKNSFAIDKIESNVDDKLFENWEKGLANNIRKAIRGIPAILIDYEDSKLGGTSGESIIQATNFYNAMTADDRKLISQAFEDVFSLSDNPVLKNNTNWNIKPLKLIDNVTTNDTTAASN